MGRQKVILDKFAQTFHVRNLLIRQALAECLGTLILVMFGCGSIAQLILSGGSHGMFLTVNFAFGFAATLGILVCGQVSGGHINPTVTYALCLLGREPWRKFPVYFLSQTLGAFLGSGIIFGMYFDAIQDYGQGSFTVVGDNATAGIFATYPSKHLNLLNGFFDQSMGFNSGYAVNPARDLGPRIFTALAGWGSEVFTANSYWSLVPIFAPFIGALLGVMVYQLMVGWHVEGEERDKRETVEQEEKDMFKLSAVSDKETL
ncbi:hypothetical protein DNTS_003147 [Danionella cerebrum]|uniref:Aquaporin-3 n=1 Tax=Danionella cerebrum TaxID=2873325 RepID=A0A553N5V8_9TELE|nr:hypothetical protein DNTS_003147 [Danionella translucida]